MRLKRRRGGDRTGEEQMHGDGEETHIMRLYIMTGIAGADRRCRDA